MKVTITQARALSTMQAFALECCLFTICGSSRREETTAICISFGPANCRKRLLNSVRRSAAAFQGGFSHICGPRAGSSIRTRSEHSLEEGGHLGDPSSRWSPGFTSKKDGGVASNFRSAAIEPLSSKLTVKQVVSQIRSEDWFVTIDLKDAYFHISILPSHRKFLRFSFRGEAYQYRVPPVGLALSPRTFHKVYFHELLWLLCDTRASAYSITSTIG